MAYVDTLFKEVAEYQINKMKLTGTRMEINDTPFWNKFMHKWTNTEWTLIFDHFNEIKKLAPTVLNTQWKQIAAAEQYFNKNKSVDRCMDKRNNAAKGKAWSTVMIIRELYMAIHGIDEKDLLSPQAVTPQPQKIRRNKVTTEQTVTADRTIVTTTMFHNLFEEE